MFKPAKLNFNSMRNAWVTASVLLLSVPVLPMPAQAQGLPEITPSLKKMLGALPIADLNDEVNSMVGALKKTSCGGNLTGCYAAQSGAIQLYFFTQ